MIDIGKREPHDEKTPAEVMALVHREWIEGRHGMRIRPLADCILDALAYKAYFEGSESALRWLDPEGDILARVLNGEVTP